ncbi:cysteine-rich receptor-like protein kinase 10 [Tanacetum coccineum]
MFGNTLAEPEYIGPLLLEVANNNFLLENKLGEGGFGPVYKGKLQDGKEVAVKRLSRNSSQGLVEFKTKDMKASNIVLDNEMNLKISDFGTTRIFGGNQMDGAINRIVGTYGYMAPEYAMEGLFSTKSDVYSFGALNENKGEQMIDSRIIQNILIDEALRWINFALMCIQEDHHDRPTMSTIVFMLEGQWTANLPAPSEPPVSFARFAAVVSEQTTTTGDQTEHLTSSRTSFAIASSSTVS